MELVFISEKENITGEEIHEKISELILEFENEFNTDNCKVLINEDAYSKAKDYSDFEWRQFGKEYISFYGKPFEVVKTDDYTIKLVENI